MSEDIKVLNVGAGFMGTLHAKAYQEIKGVRNVGIVTRNYGSSESLANILDGDVPRFTDFEEALEKTSPDAVAISTYTDSHYHYVSTALKKGLHVFVEKPLAITPEELNAIAAFYNQCQEAPVLFTGFNRRFSPYVQRIKDIVTGRNNPMIIDYQMNAGRLPPEHWVHTTEGGGRNIGEAYHIYDVFTFLTEAKITRVHTTSISPTNDYYRHRDNFVTTLTFEEGTVATLTYTALGSKAFPKEQMKVYSDGRIVILDNYQNLNIYGAKTKGMRTAVPDKGHKQELAAFAGAVQKGQNWPILLWEQIQATEISFRVEASF